MRKTFHCKSNTSKIRKGRRKKKEGDVSDSRPSDPRRLKGAFIEKTSLRYRLSSFKVKREREKRVGEAIVDENSPH
jgi:hypothetical protein